MAERVKFRVRAVCQTQSMLQNTQAFSFMTMRYPTEQKLRNAGAELLRGNVWKFPDGSFGRSSPYDGAFAVTNEDGLPPDTPPEPNQ